ncbi:MAG: ATP-binding protein [Akkermansia sp.]|nr:ATP-binding protein [Akkermansia sp.]
MKREKYRSRVIDEKVQMYLATFGAVCIEGPKWCGKTWTAQHHCTSSISLGDPAGGFMNKKLAETDPGIVLEGEKPRLIDEWQEVPPLWDAVRYAVDADGMKGQYLLTGSATPQRKGILHSGTGRIARLRMRPMSLYESGDSSGQVSLQEICEGCMKPAMTGEVNLNQVIRWVVRGGWPGSLELPLKQAAEVPREYLRNALENDIYRMDGIRRDAGKIQRLLRSLARHESTTATCSKITQDIKQESEETIDRETVNEYMDLLERLFLVENQPAYSSNLRSSVRVKQAPKRHLADPSLACALLQATPEMLLGDLNTLGFLFEALCERDLNIYAESFGGRLFHYQDYKNREVDAVIEMPDGRWCAFEIKLGAQQIDKAAASLVALRNSFTEQPGAKAPSVLGVVCGLSHAAYQRPDGVYVFPIGALRP